MPSAAALAYLPSSSSDPWVAILKVASLFGIQFVIPALFLCWIMSEICFYILMRYLHRHLDKLTAPERSSNPEEVLQKVMEVIYDLRDVYSIETFITRWCGAESMADIKRGNVASFLAWALFSSKVEDLLPSDYVSIWDMVDRLEKHFGMNLEPGLNPKARTLRMTLEPLEVIHRPLFIYVIVSAIPRFFGEAYLKLQGFTRLEYMEMKYWYRPSREWQGKLPLVFFHGVSPGQCTYAGLTTLLAEGRSAILIEIPHIAMSLEEFRAKTENEVVQAIQGITRRHSIDHFCVAGHSYGTILAGWVIKSMRHEVKQAVLLDPVCLLLCLPNTPFNFLYKHVSDSSHHRGSVLSRFKQRLFDYGLYVVSRELTVANAMRRQFWWHQKILHAEDIHCPAIVGLASDDLLLSAPAIRRYLKDRCPQAQVVWWEDFAHGELLAAMPRQCELDRLIREQEHRCYGCLAHPAWEGRSRRRGRRHRFHAEPAYSNGSYNKSDDLPRFASSSLALSSKQRRVSSMYSGREEGERERRRRSRDGQWEEVGGQQQQEGGRGTAADSIPPRLVRMASRKLKKSQSASGGLRPGEAVGGGGGGGSGLALSSTSSSGSLSTVGDRRGVSAAGKVSSSPAESPSSATSKKEEGEQVKNAREGGAPESPIPLTDDLTFSSSVSSIDSLEASVADDNEAVIAAAAALAADGNSSSSTAEEGGGGGTVEEGAPSLLQALWSGWWSLTLIGQPHLPTTSATPAGEGGGKEGDLPTSPPSLVGEGGGKEAGKVRIDHHHHHNQQQQQQSGFASSSAVTAADMHSID